MIHYFEKKKERKINFSKLKKKETFKEKKVFSLNSVQNVIIIKGDLERLNGVFIFIIWCLRRGYGPLVLSRNALNAIVLTLLKSYSQIWNLFMLIWQPQSLLCAACL